VTNPSHSPTIADDAQTSGIATCRFCGAPLSVSFADLGMTPLSNAYVPIERAKSMEPFYPLHAWACTQCWLVQLEVFESAENIFDDYAYFSSYSDSWLAHARRYVDQMRARFALGTSSHVIEVASNDGYLLQYFQKAGVPILGIEPSHTVAKAAIEKGIPTRIEFFGVAAARRLVQDSLQADLLLGNNVLAHVPDINDFVAGMKIALKPLGVITMEFPHLKKLVDECQFDTIYHEHFSYLSFSTVERIFARHALTLFDVEELPTHGGSLRIYARHQEDLTKPVESSVPALRAVESRAGFDDVELYSKFADRVKATKRNLLSFLIEAKREGKTIVGYGAAAKGNTLLNYCGVGTDMIDYTVDRNPHKQGRLLPGTRIPIHAPERIRETRPDYVLILPWNLREEIAEQMAWIRQWGGQFVVPIPEVRVF
jgi:SAM-dependent methyltransferase